jgi:DNA invertase Pin-like site-specific DNA recombinase
MAGPTARRLTCSTRSKRSATRRPHSSRLGDVWADTTTPHGRLILTVLGGIAEFERELIKIRTTDGRIRAKAAGKKFGRKPKLTVFEEIEIVRRRADGETVKDLARSFGVSHPSILRAMERREEAA